MISKKKKKAIFISIISLVLVAVISIGTVFVLRKKSNKNNNLTSSNMSQVDSNLLTEAIFNGDVSANYNGTYKFKTIKDLEFSDKLTKQEIQALYKNKNVSNKNELFDLLKKEKDDAAKAGELLVLSDGCINKTTGTDKNRTPVLNSEGKFVGDDNISRVTIFSTNEIAKTAFAILWRGPVSMSRMPNPIQ